MTTNNHPANGPVSLDRLQQISEILSKASAQSNGGNLGYAMADAVKVINGLLDSEPVAYMTYKGYLLHAGDPKVSECSEPTPLYTTPQAVLDDVSIFEAAIEECKKCDSIDEHAWNHGVLAVMSKYDACRAAMLQAGNSPVTPDCWCRICRPVTMSDMRFVVCPECGNKRCPHANDHNNACTGSNEPGQVGSAYPAAPQQEVKS